MAHVEGSPKAASSGWGLVVGLVGFVVLWGLVGVGWWSPRPGYEGVLIGRTLAITWLMAVWWMSEALPIPVTSLLPLVLFPLAGVMSGGQTAHEYMNEVIFLFMGGFFLALGLQRWGVHRRIALILVLRTGGGHPRWMVLGFMVACAFLSMWMSNTATVVMLLPIVLSVIQLMEEEQGEAASRIGLVLLLGLAYAASVGGIATLVGTPTNLSFARIYKIYFPAAPEMSFLEWMKIGLPITLVLLPTLWALLVFVFFRGAFAQEAQKDSGVKDWLQEQLREMGPMRRQERLVLVIFAVTALLWVFRTDLRFGDHVRISGWMSLLGLTHQAKIIKDRPALPSLGRGSRSSSQPRKKRVVGGVTLGADEELIVRKTRRKRKPLFGDGVVAILMALLLFLLPAGGGEPPGTRLLDWETANKIPWGMLLLFGGGFALAAGIKKSGTSAWIGEIFRWPVLSSMGTFGILLFLCVLITFLTEFTSNTATTEISLAMLAPVVATFGGTGVHPYLLMVPVTIAASCAFMMPVATPPNAMVYASGRVPIREMVRVGVWLNLLLSLLVALLLYVIFWWMGIPLRVKPGWVM